MLLRFLALGILLMGCTENSTASRGYDPGLIIYRPEARVFSNCGGLTLGLDPDWEFEARFEADGRNGIPRHVYEASFSNEVAEVLNPSPLAPYTFTPLASIGLYCETVSSPEGEAARIADQVAERRRTHATAAGVTRRSLQNASGIWETVSYERTSENGNKFFVQRLYQLRNGKLVRLRLSSNEFAKTPVRGLAPSGEIYRISFANAPPVEDRLARPVLISEKGALVGERGRSVSLEFFQQVLTSLSGAT